MPIITAAPIIIDVASGPDPGTADELFTGPYSLNGNLYALAKSLGAPSTTPVNCPTIYKSTDNGATWTNITGALSAGMTGYTWCWDDLSATPNIITFAFHPSGDWNLRDFDLNTETWGATYGTVGAPTDALNRAQGGMKFVRLSNGIVKFVTGQNLAFGGDGNLYYSVCAASGNWTAINQAITVDGLNHVANCACIDTNNLMHFVYTHVAGGLRRPHYNNLSTGNVLGTPFDFTGIPVAIVPHNNRIYVSGGSLYLGELNFNGAATTDKVGMWTGAPNPTLSTPSWTEALVWDVSGSLPPTFSTVFQYARASGYGALIYQRSETTGETPQLLTGGSLSPVTGDQVMFIVLYDNSTSPSTSYLYYSILSSGTWSTPAVYYNSTTDPPTGWTGVVGPLMLGMSIAASESTAPVTVTCSITITGLPIPTSGGRAFVKLTLNFFNACLGREYLLYQLINRELLKCGVKPFCFCIDERDWGGNFSEHEEVPMGPPEGAIAFNPTGQIVMPTVASGDNTIFQFRVPTGYDGVILGQYHQYIQPLTAFPPPIFVEGSGDLVWRLEVAGRFVRDCGEMEVSLGSLQNMSPIAGGLQVRSGNLIRYVAAAPNVTGTLMAGVGNTVAGVHGWFWQRT